MSQATGQTHAFWAVVIEHERLWPELWRGRHHAAIETGDPSVFAPRIELVFLAGHGPFLLLGTASGVMMDAPPSGPIEFELDNFDRLEKKALAPAYWVKEQSRMWPGRVGNGKCQFHEMTESDANAAVSLLAQWTGNRISEPDEPDYSDRSNPRLSELISRSMSPRAREVLEAAEDFVQRKGEWAPVSSEELLNGLLWIGDRDRKTPSGSTNRAAGNLVQIVDRLNPEFLRERFYEVNEGAFGTNYERRITAELNGVFDFSRDLAVRMGNSEGHVSVRHLTAGILALASYQNRETEAQRILRAGGVMPGKVLEEFVTSLAVSGPENERTFWRELLNRPAEEASSSPAPVTTSGDPLRSWLPSFNADLSSGEDKLGVSADVAAMASLIVSNSLQPPLSIGLFGNWGSGKSFFMGKLRDKIRSLARSADAEDRRVYWPNVVTVEFNAWHYVDANLWASLVAHLFAQLRIWGKPEDGVTAQVLQQKNAALNQLKVASEARDAAKKRLEEAERALSTATQKHDDAISSVRINNLSLSRELVRDLWGELKTREDLAGPLRTAATQLHESHLVVSESVESVEELYDQLKSLSETGGRLRATGWTMLHGRGRGLALTWLLGGTAVALLLGLKNHWWNFDFGPAAALVAQGAAIVIGVAQWVTRSAQHVSTLIEPLDDVRRKIERAFKAVRDERDQAVQKFKKEVETSMVQVTISAQAVTTAEQTVAAAKAAVEEATTARMISRFIEGRAASDDYRKHLGIVSTIREDFDQLSKLICAHNQLLLAPSADAILDGAKDLGINRIVLFVDDLDRCPPARVVEVLQAIHLLLAFPLFVVVVGVDSRWVEHSLAVEHPELLRRTPDSKSERAEKSRDDDGRNGIPATPSDYLEKIFQIPYRVRRMDDSGCRNLIDALVAGDREARRQAETDGATTVSLRSPSGSPISPERVVAASPTESDSPSASGMSPHVSAPPLVSPPSAPTALLVPKITMESLKLTEREIHLMRGLAPLIGRSPRATKRFVNIYRLIKAAVPFSEQHAFVEGGFRAPMLLLATATRNPLLVRQLMLESERRENPEAIARLETLWSEQFPDGAGESTAEARAKFSQMNKIWSELTPAEIHRWQHRVAQFSFEETRSN